MSGIWRNEKGKLFDRYKKGLKKIPLLEYLEKRYFLHTKLMIILKCPGFGSHMVTNWSTPLSIATRLEEEE